MAGKAGEIRIENEALRSLVREIFKAAGSNERECAIVADHLVEANLRGHDSHGVGMLPAYIANALIGECRLGAAPTVATDLGQLLILEADRGLGQTMAHDAVAMAIERAKAQGSCIMALRNSHHIGRIGHWSEQCVRAGMVSIHFVNVISTPAVAPFGGPAARVGTNPISIGLPRPGKDPFIVDFATSRLAVGKIRVAYNKGVDVPEGVLLDGHGEPTTNPAALFEEPLGALRTFGEHKGWTLSFACDLLAGALAGGATQKGPKSRDAIINNMFCIVVSPEAMGTAASYAREIEAYAEWVTRPPEGRDLSVLLPGQPELATRADRLANRIPVDTNTWDQILAAGVSVKLSRDAMQRIAGVA